MNLIDETFGTTLAAGKKVLSVFLTAGYPTPGMTIRLAAGLAKAGADLIELGIPFSDPLADGPVIQECSREALSHGMTPGRVLTMVREIRKSTGVPIILMGYVNPLLSYGIDQFISDATSSGANGTIVPDLPIEESSGYIASATKTGMATVFMVSPTTSDLRIGEIDLVSRGFVYAVTVNGVTGMRVLPAEAALTFIRRARRHVTRNPLLAGFGISDPSTATTLAGCCDGVIIGSAIMNRLRNPDPETGYRMALDFVSSIRTALDG